MSDQITNRFSQAKVTVVGDVILDKYIWGGVDRISPEAPVVVVKVKEENYRLGGSANVAHNIVSLGGQASLVGCVGDDTWGKDVVTQLEKVGISSDGIVFEKGRQTTIKTRVVAHSQQVVRIDRETDESFSDKVREELIGRLSVEVDSASGLIVSDYAKGVIDNGMLETLSAWYENKRVGQLDKPMLCDPKNINFDSYNGATIVTPNKKEASEASGVVIKNRTDALKAAKILKQKWNSQYVLVTLGEMGMLLYSDEGHSEINTVAREVFDVSGAGDTVSATFLLSMAVGATPFQAALLANQAAGIVVREVGTAVVTLEALQKEIAKG